MRKTLITVFITLSVVLIYGYAGAITGVCYNCHTMHNSQGGAAVDPAGPNERLLSAGCVACHSGTNAQFTGDGKNDFGAPIVLRTGAAPGGQGGTNTLAGGDFYWVADTGGNTDSKGHNVVSIATTDTIGLTPPGWDKTASSGTFDGRDMVLALNATTWASQLTCAGEYGCHGTHSSTGTFTDLQGAHHGNTGGTATQASAPTTVGGSFRFLASIKGLEHSAWNYGETAAAHNEYFGANSPNSRNYDAATTTYTDKQTISFLCAECHGNFHSKIANDAAYAYGDPWRRHPTDIALPTSGEYAIYNTADGSTIGSYSLQAPIARSTVPASSGSTVTAGTDRVMCLSCHRAHGSAQADLLRWDYSTMIAGGSNSGGCFVCHTGKNATGINP